MESIQHPKKQTKLESSCHQQTIVDISGLKKLVLVGNPNVGKSVIFQKLTGAYATVSNYPGTTVEITKAKAKVGDKIEVGVIDTPGTYSLIPVSEDEKVSRRILFEDSPDLVIHVVDAKNLERMLPLTLQLLTCEFMLILNLNMMDEAEKLGIEIDIPLLEAKLGIPVVPTAGINGTGIDSLKARIEEVILNSNHN